MALLCTHFQEGCSGCSLSENLSRPSTFDEAAQFFANHFNYLLTLSSGSLKGWRTRAKLAVRGSVKNPAIGLFKTKTHSVISNSTCQMHDPLINQAVLRIKQWMMDENIVPYDEKTGGGELRYLQLTVERSSQTVQAVLVLNREIEVAKLQFIRGGWHSLWINLNTSATNEIFSEKWEKVEGKDLLEETLINQSFSFHPAVFAQGNLEQYELVLHDMIKKVKKGKRVLEFYGGVGTIGRTLAPVSKNVVITELNRYGKASFHDCKNVQFIETDAFRGISLLKDAEVVVLDPPRKGVNQELLEAIVKTDTVEQILYLSCGFPSFKKQALFLKENGFKLSFAKSYLFFPGTSHLETFAVFER